MFDTVGWIGGVLLAFCGIPQAYKSWKEKSSEGLSWSFLLMWGFGEVFLLMYAVPKMLLPVMFNLSINILTVLVIIYYKWEES